MKLEGGRNDLIERIAADPLFPLTREEIDAQMAPEQYVGRAPGQVTAFLRDEIDRLVELLAVSAPPHGLHHDVLRGHEGQLLHISTSPPDWWSTTGWSAAG